LSAFFLPFIISQEKDINKKTKRQSNPKQNTGSYGTALGTTSAQTGTAAQAQQSPTVINIHEVIRPLSQQEDCNPSQWDNRKDACQCCLLFAADKANPDQSPDTLIDNCINSQHCNTDIIAGLKKDQKLSTSATNKEFLDKLTQSGLVIKRMNVDNSFFGSNGALTETSLPRFLAQAFDEKKLINPDFSKQACLKAKNLGTQGGYNTLQLFLVTSTCHAKEASMYIIKEARHGIDEATKLATVAEFDQLKDIIAPKVKPGLPTIALPLAYFSYPYTNTIHYLAAMPAAKGKDLATLINKFRQDQSPQNRELLNRAFIILGKETANFHKRFMIPQSGKKLGNTIVHGDFHVFNLFFDEIGGHFTFIDNETIAKTLKDRANPSVDIIKLFFMPFSINTDYQQFRDLIAGISLEVWFDIALKNFVIGYKDAFEKQDQARVLGELKKIFNDPIAIQWVDFNDMQLKDLRDKYINPTFDALMK
jgi:hypothetical protein